MAQLEEGQYRPDMRSMGVGIGGPSLKETLGMPLYHNIPRPMGPPPDEFPSRFAHDDPQNFRNRSPLRNSHSPNMRMAQPQFENSFAARSRMPPDFRDRRVDLESRSRSFSGGRMPLRPNKSRSPVRHERTSPFKPMPPPPMNADIPPPMAMRKSFEKPIELAFRVDELLKEIETLKIERDAFQQEAKIERLKNQELEEEFHVLRNLIQDNTRPIGFEENLLLKSQYHQEREMRITCEQDVNRLRQQLADALAGSHRDTVNLKKALTDMQQTNTQALQTIYEKGDQNLQQMQQLEDLSKIIRDKDAEIERLNQDIDDLKNQCRDLHNEIRTVKQEAAQVAGERGNALLMNSSMKDKMLDNPRFRKVVEQEEAKNMAQAMKKNP